MADRKDCLTLRATVIKGRNLAAKDKGGTSDPVRRHTPQLHFGCRGGYMCSIEANLSYVRRSTSS